MRKQVESSKSDSTFESLTEQDKRKFGLILAVLEMNAGELDCWVWPKNQKALIKLAESSPDDNYLAEMRSWKTTVGHIGRKRDSYGTFITESGSIINAHRLVAQLNAMELKGDQQVDHVCENTMCVNFSHLAPVSPQSNADRRVRSSVTDAILKNIATFYTPEQVESIAIDKRNSKQIAMHARRIDGRRATQRDVVAIKQSRGLVICNAGGGYSITPKRSRKPHA
jgi:hypothetical protein